MNRKYNTLPASEASRQRGRTLYLIDVENMACSCELTAASVGKISTRLYAAVEPQDGDHTVVAASQHNALAAYFGWAGPVRLLARSGKDGADLALLEVVADSAWVASRYDCVVVASGDHAFAPAVTALKVSGLRVIVVPPDTGFSAQMRLAAGPDVVRLGSSFPGNVINLFSTIKDAA